MSNWSAESQGYWFSRCVYQELIPRLLNELLKRQQRELAEVGALRKELAELRAPVGQRREIAASSR